MNHRIYFSRLSIAVAIGMLVAAAAYRAEAPSQAAANPPAADSILEIQNEKNSAQLQVQKRVARSRL